MWGSLRPQNITGGRGRDPDWDCFVDGNNTGQPWTYPTRAYSNFLLCWGQNITDGDHTLELKATVQSQTLWVDQVQYQASKDVDVSAAWTEVGQDDGRFRYSDGWDEDSEGYRRSTYTPGAWLTYDFTGVSGTPFAAVQTPDSVISITGEGVIFGAYTPGSATAVDGLASYILDGDSPIDFKIPATTVSKYNQPYFQITGLKPGPHRLQVTNKGNSSTAPLAFTYVYSKNAHAESTPEVRPNKVPKIIGGAVGGGLGAILLAVLLVFCVLHFRKRRQKRKEQLIVAPIAAIPEEKTGTHSVLSKNVTGSTYVSHPQLVANQWNGQSQPSALQHHTSQPLLSQYPSSSQLSSPQSPPKSHTILAQPPPSQVSPSQHIVPSLYPASSFPPPQPALSHSSSFTPQRRTPPATVPQNNAWANVPESQPQADVGRMTYLQTTDGKPDEFNPYQFARDLK